MARGIGRVLVLALVVFVGWVGWHGRQATGQAPPKLTELPIRDVVKGEIDPEYPEDGPAVFLAPGGRHLIAMGTRDGHAGLMLDGQTLSPCGDWPSVAFTPDGAHWWYVYRKDRKHSVVVLDGKPVEDGVRCGFIYPVVVSDDGRHLAYAGAPDGGVSGESGNPIYEGGCLVVVDGKKGPIYDTMDGPTMTADGSRLAYAGQPRGKGQEAVPAWHAVIDGVEGPAYGRVPAPRFSSDSKHVAYVATERGKSGGRTDWDGTPLGKDMLVMDGVAGPPYDRVAEWLFSPDGHHLAYVAGRGQWHGGPDSFAATEETLVLDGVAGPTFARIERLQFSPDSRRVAYVARSSDPGPIYDPLRQAEIPESVVVGEHQGAWYHQVGEFQFSRDGSRYGYTARDEAPGKPLGNWCNTVVIDGAPGPPHKCVEYLTFSADSRRVAYVARDNKQGREPFDLGDLDSDTGSPTALQMGAMPTAEELSRRRLRLFGPAWLVVDGVEGPEYEDVGQPVFAPVGNRLACWVKRGGQWRVWLDGHEGEPYDGAEDIEYPYRDATQDAVALYFSPDGTHLAYWARKGKAWHMVVDGRESPAFDCYYDELGFLPVLFTPDSRHLAYVGRRGGQGVLVLDGHEVGTYDRVYSRSVGLDATGTLRCAARRGRTYYYVECRAAA